MMVKPSTLGKIMGWMLLVGAIVGIIYGAYYVHAHP